jgi:hypothetical protein
MQWTDWILVLLGWPAVVIGCALAVAGAISTRPRLLVAAGAVLLPSSLYLTATPRFWWAFAIPLLCWTAAALARRGARAGAALIILSVIAFFAWLAVVVLSQ